MSDLIRRTDVIDLLEEHRQSIFIGSAGYTDANEIADTIEVLKTILSSSLTIKSVQQWIPCSERLPDTSTEVLVTLGYTYESDYTMYSIARYIHFENGECHWCDNHYGYLEWDKYSDGRGGDSSRKVIAWCPLPSVYKGD